MWHTTKKWRAIYAMLGLAACLMWAPRPVSAQALGSIVGNVTDPSGRGVPNARVTATEAGTSFARTATTNAQGQYVFPSLRPTEYDLTVEVPGFRKYSQTGVVLLANQAMTVDVRLEIGSVRQTVTISSAAPLVNTTTATLNNVVGSTEMVELPLNGRAAAELISLVPGASSVPMTTVMTQAGGVGSVTADINGSRNDQTAFLLDGADDTDDYYMNNIPFPFPDALQEFSVQTNNYSAKYGENSGAIVNAVTKSGTNQVHGDLFEFVRTPGLDSREFFSPSVDLLHENQFGGTVGGPVVIPGVYNGHDRTFFFFGYQGTRYHDVTTSSAFVPTQANLNGDFSALLSATNPDNPEHSVVTVDNPATGQPFAGNLIPTSLFDPASLGLEKYLPQVGGEGEVFYPVPVDQPLNEYIGRIDQKLSQKDQLMFRVDYNGQSLDPVLNTSDLLNYALGYNIPIKNYIVQETHSFSPNLLNEFRAYYTSVPVDKLAPANSPDLGTFGVKAYQPSPPVIQGVGVSGFFSVSGGAAGVFNEQTAGIADDVSWVMGRQTFQFGGSLSWGRIYYDNSYEEGGDPTFEATPTNYAVSSFLLGRMYTWIQGNGQYEDIRDWFPAFYGEDTLHATRRLTFDLGLRYEPYFPWREIHGRVEEFEPSAFYADKTSQVYVNAPPGLFFPGDPGVPFDGTTGDFRTFAPRVGFAYDLTGDGKTSIRGGAGIFYDTTTSANVENIMNTLSPFAITEEFTEPSGPFSNPYEGIVNPFPAPFAPPKTTAFPAPVVVASYAPNQGFIVPPTYQWNLTLERQLAPSWMAELAYVGMSGSNQVEEQNLNPAVYIPGSTLSDGQRRLISNEYGDITMVSEDANMNFNALEISLEKRMSQRLSIEANYTWSKGLSDIPGYTAGGASSNTFTNATSPTVSTYPWYFPDRHQMNYGPEPFNMANRFVAAYNYNLPALSRLNGVARAVLGSWEWTGIATAQSGFPFTVVAGEDRSETGLDEDRAVQIGSAFGPGACGVRAPCVNDLIPGSFEEPALGTFGSTGVGSLYGPGLFDWDMGVFKNFPVTERWKLQFRAEFFNIFNRANFSNPTSSKAAAAFGSITGVADNGRIAQLSLKLFF